MLYIKRMKVNLVNILLRYTSGEYLFNLAWLYQQQYSKYEALFKVIIPCWASHLFPPSCVHHDAPAVPVISIVCVTTANLMMFMISANHASLMVEDKLFSILSQNAPNIIMSERFSYKHAIKCAPAQDIYPKQRPLCSL